MSRWKKILTPKAPWRELAAPTGGGGAHSSGDCPRRVASASLRPSATGLPAHTEQVPFL